MGNEHEKFYISQKAMIYDPSEKKFLLMKDARTEGEFYKNCGPWEMIGGRIDKEENFTEALEREIREEAGEIEYDIIGIIDSSLSPQPYGETAGADATFLVYYRSGDVALSDEHSEYRWETAENIEKDPEYKEWLKERVRKAVVRIQSEEYLNDLKRCQAEFENYKKRQQESQKDLKGLLIEKLVLDIIPVLDNFRSATMHVPAEQKESPWVVGIQYIEKQLEAVLTDNGMRTIEVTEGEEFDPSIHEAISHEKDSDNESEKHLIATVIQKGYKFGDRVIRPARVTVK